MAKRRAHKGSISRGKAAKGWAGFSPFQLIVILSVFLVFAIFYLM